MIHASAVARLCLIAAAVVATTAVRAEHVEPVADSPADQPVTAGRGPVPELLRQLDRQGRLAGNVGDIYDNRDRGHSMLPLKQFPQLHRVVYSEADRQHHRDWALPNRIRPGVVVGNSSTSAAPSRQGSNPRTLLVRRGGLRFAWTQYLNNNLYVYPEHRDYEPGPFAIDDAGDWYHAHTPYVLISRGSSGSDQPLVRAVFWSLAAMRPAVKQRLTDEHLLMATVQMLLRRSQRHVTSDGAYLDAATHPPVFDADQLDVGQMVMRAHRLSPDRLPPLASMRIMDESASRLNRDYWLPQQPERWGQTPGAISRVFRGPRPHYELVIDLSNSYDADDRSLRFEWRLLSGDRALVEIERLTPTGSRARMRVAFHNDPIDASDGSGVQTRRVDIACFAHNGVHYSPPSIVSIYMPPQLRHTVADDGRVIEIGSGAFASALRPPRSLDEVINGDGYVGDWPGLAGWFLGDTDTAALPASALSPSRRAQLEDIRQQLADPLEDLHHRRDALRRAQADWQDARDPQRKAALRTRHDTAQRMVEMADRRLCRMLYAWRGQGGESACALFIDSLRELRDDPEFFTRRQGALPGLSHRALALRDRLVDLGILTQVDGRWRVRSVGPGDRPIAERATVFERNQLAAFHEHILAEVCDAGLKLPELMVGDRRVSLPHCWRNVYHYDDAGEMTGWTRYSDASRWHFNAVGQLLVEGDPDGGPPVNVRYVPDGENVWSQRLRMVAPDVVMPDDRSAD